MLKKILLISYYGLQKSSSGSTRIYNLLKELCKNNQVDVLFPNLLQLENNLYNYNFINNIYLYPVKKSLTIHRFRNKTKEMLGVDYPKNNKGISESIKAFILNNYIFYNVSFSQEIKRYYVVKYKNDFLKSINLQTYDVLITSSGPSIMNYFGYKVKKKNPNIFWVADYRDLNQNNPYKSDKFNFKGKKMDKLVFKYADLITTVSYGAKEQNIENARKMGYDIRDRTYVLYNGYSKDEVSRISSFELSKKYKDILSSLKIKIIFTGTIYPLRRIDLFFEALREVDNALFVYAGGSYDLVDYYRNKLKIESKVINLKVISKEEAEFLQRNSDILLQLKADVKEDGILTGKFFEYLQKNKRILSLGDKDEEYNEICKSLKNVDILPYDKGRIAEYINSLKLEDLKENYDPNIERFSWEILAKEFDDFISQKLRERKSTA